MDPFTQRMLERAKARREKLDTQLSNAGVDVKKQQRSPLKSIISSTSSNNDETRREVEQEVKKSPVKAKKAEEPRRTYNEEAPRRSRAEEVRRAQQQADEEIRRRRYDEESEDEDEDQQIQAGRSKPNARLDRLAALASEINNWEDDLSHPRVVKQTKSKAEIIQSRFNQQVKNAQEPQPSTSGYKKPTKTSTSDLHRDTARQSKWGKSVIDSPTKQSPNKREVDNKENNKTPTKTYKSLTERRELTMSNNSTANSPVSQSSKNSGTPEKRNNPASNSRSRFAFANNSPASPGSVLSKASMFESKGNETKARDPTEMSLIERMALFEKNKGGPPLIPKAPLTMSVPVKQLFQKETVVSPAKKSQQSSTMVKKTIFEQGTRTQELENDILKKVHMERQKELEMLRSRFNKNKESATQVPTGIIRTSESSEGPANSSKNSPVCQVKPTPATDYNNQVPPPPPPLPTQSRSVATQSPRTRYMPRQANNAMHGPPKPQRLYPDLSNLMQTETSETEFTCESSEPETATLEEKTETETDGEFYLQDETDYNSSEESSEPVLNSSFGRSVLRVVSQQSALKKKRTIDPDPDSTTSDISVIDEMDEYSEDYKPKKQLHGEGPTPPKLNRACKNSAASHSFKYSQAAAYRSPIKVISPQSPRKREPYVIDDGNAVPLMHSVSFYRRQQSQVGKSPVRTITRDTPRTEDDNYLLQYKDERERALVQDKIKSLQEEVCKQQTIIGQASQALNFCTSTIEFSGSREQVEGESVLLVASHKRQAALDEIQRLKIEGTLRPATPGYQELEEKGSLTISAITLPLRKDYFRNKDYDTRLHFICLIRHLETVIATPVVSVEMGDSCIRFPSTLKLQDLYSDFKITVELYSLQTNAEVLPHEIKYHIGNLASGSGSSHKKVKTPKKGSKQDRLITNLNPAGPSAVRSTAFTHSGLAIFSLKEVHRQEFALSSVPPSSPLDKKIQMHISCELSVSVEHRGFLTMFEDVSGFGAWHRRWCLLKGSIISYWKYPDDELRKTPIGSLDLQGIITKNVGLVSRDICARPHTFLLETSRPAAPSDTDSLVMVRNGNKTTLRHLLSADTKEDRVEWCTKLNKTLTLMRAWGEISN